MRIKSIMTLLALPMLAASFVASAQNSPVGRWKTYDEDTGKPRLIVEVYEAKGGTFAAKVVDTLFQGSDQISNLAGHGIECMRQLAYLVLAAYFNCAV